MGAYKNFLMGIEELVYDALEKGFTDEEGIYAYVYERENRIDFGTVKNILDSFLDSDYDYYHVNEKRNIYV